MNGLEYAPSAVGEVASMLVQYFEGCVLGVLLGVLLVQLARKIKANASWLVAPPVVSLGILPSMHASVVLTGAGVVAMLISVAFVGLKGPFGEFGIRDALEYWWVRIAVSLLAGFLLLQVVSFVVLIVSAAIIGGLAGAWWNHGLRGFLEGLVQ